MHLAFGQFRIKFDHSTCFPFLVSYQNKYVPRWVCLACMAWKTATSQKWETKWKTAPSWNHGRPRLRVMDVLAFPGFQDRSCCPWTCPDIHVDICRTSSSKTYSLDRWVLPHAHTRHPSMTRGPNLKTPIQNPDIPQKHRVYTNFFEKSV